MHLRDCNTTGCLATANTSLKALNKVHAAITETNGWQVHFSSGHLAAASSHVIVDCGGWDSEPG